MKVIGLGMALLLATLASLHAQVPKLGIDVEVTQEQEQFLPGEALRVTVRTTNRSGRTLLLGREKDWLTFSVESRDGPVVKRGDVPVEGEIELESSKVAVVRVDLEPYFAVTRRGRYSIVATVRIKEWNLEVSSPPTAFEVVAGTPLWEQEVGVPQAPGATNTLPEVRRYTLLQVNSLKGQIRLYLRVSDAQGNGLRVSSIGRLVSFGRPEPQLDRFSRLHLIYQSGPSAFSYRVFDHRGDLVVRQTYDYVGTRPRLRTDDDGNISVIGGVRRLTDYDVPPRPNDEDQLSEPATRPAVPPPFGASKPASPPGVTNTLRP
jgi:hypothetical protein